MQANRAAARRHREMMKARDQELKERLEQLNAEHEMLAREAAETRSEKRALCRAAAVVLATIPAK